MSQHRSLRGTSLTVKHRNVLKRTERFQRLMQDEKTRGRESAYNLPKLKSIKMKTAKSAGKAAEKPKEGETKPASGGEKAA